MRVILYGATGMVGQGVLRECLLDPDVTAILVITRTPTGQSHPKLREIVHPNFYDFSTLEAEMTGYDACFFCLGVSSLRMSEPDYRRLTTDITLAAARVLARRNPQMTFIYVSGTGTDSSERGRSMWARVKGHTENQLLALPFKAKYMFRPGFIQPLHGIKSKTRWIRALYLIVGGLFPLLDRLFPGAMTTTVDIGRAMIAAARSGAPQVRLENRDINALARAAAG